MILASNAGIQAEGNVSSPVTIVIGLFPAGYASGNDALVIEGAKISSWSVDMSPDDVMEETAEWSGTGISWKRCEEIA